MARNYWIRKNIENSQRIQIKKHFDLFVSTRLRKHSANLSFDCQLFYPPELIVTQHGSTLLNWCLKTLKTVKKIQTKKRFHIFVCARLRKHSADLSFNCWLFYPTKMILTQYGSTLLNWCLKTFKTVKKFKQRNVSLFS